MAEETASMSFVTVTLLLTCCPVAHTHESFRQCFRLYRNWVPTNRTVRIQLKSVPLRNFTQVGATVPFPTLLYHIYLPVRQYTGRDGALTLSHYFDLCPYRKR
jgi:hypothetical protein